MSDTLKDQLQRWRDNQPQPSKPKPSVLFKTRHTGKHALHNYQGVVEFPHTRGGGVLWMKSLAALTNYERKGYKVVWL
jgi:hypothetical protein